MRSSPRSRPGSTCARSRSCWRCRSRSASSERNVWASSKPRCWSWKPGAGTLAETIKKRQAEVRRSLLALERSSKDGGDRVPRGSRSERSSLPEAEKLEAPRRKTLANLSDRGLKEVEALKVDLGDAEQLENKIQDEKQQLAYLFQDLQEQESILELNRQLQTDLIRKKHDERLVQLESYRKLKTSEQQVEQLIGQFNSRLELGAQNEAERQDLARAQMPRCQLG